MYISFQGHYATYFLLNYQTAYKVCFSAISLMLYIKRAELKTNAELLSENLKLEYVHTFHELNILFKMSNFKCEDTQDTYQNPVSTCAILFTVEN